MEKQIDIAHNTKSSKNNNLECIRGVAASLVFIGHLFSLIPTLDKNKNHITNLFVNWGTESVIIFFILSGIVIHSSFERNPKCKKDFIKDRFIRLHALLIPVVLLTAILSYLISNEQLSLWKIIGNAVPFSSINAYVISTYYNTNPVIWSLGFEVFFYLCFMVLINNRKRVSFKFILIWLTVSLISIVIHNSHLSSGVTGQLIAYLAFSALWLMGYLIWKYKDIIRTNTTIAIYGFGLLPLVSRLHITVFYYDPLKYLLFGICSIPVFVVSITNNRSKFSKASHYLIALIIAINFYSTYKLSSDVNYTLSVKVMYILLPTFLLLLFSISHVKEIALLFYKKLLPFWSYMGKISYSFYLIHYPIIVFIVHFIHTSLLLQIILIFLLTFISTHLIEHYYQPIVRKALLQKSKPDQK